MINEIYFVIVNSDIYKNSKDYIIGSFNDEDLKIHIQNNNIFTKWINLKGFNVNEIEIKENLYVEKKHNQNGTSRFILTSRENLILHESNELILCLKYISDTYKK